jgi:putative methyltransferase (TIGR04325 family)
MNFLKRLARDLTPPLVWRGLKRLKTLGSRPEWEYVAATWPATVPDLRVKGWNVEAVRAAYQAKWPAFVTTLSNTDPFGTSVEAVSAGDVDLDYHNAIMCYAYVLALAARQKAALSMLDWGGGFGHYGLIGRALLPGLALDYHCKDVPLLAEQGRNLLTDAHFYTDETCLARTYDLVLASASLHYAPDWATTLRGLARATAGYLFVTRLPVALHGPGYVYVQRPYRFGYDTEYLSWCVNRGEFIEQATSQGLRLVREFVTGEQPPIVNAPEACQYRGYLFQPERR